ncbi:hypothetical protein DEO72_LG2g4294 [Vigna unguiculata]|uniref:Uncharacterized protein n=1 Tax=Vigna unguiculata TaxID=3917 RepID=A0A4D6L681_VIGUN|nr:hypothetical protein DEO72_LG2g4294 [Vigna unguiculata]
MAAELVGGALLSSFVNVAFDRLASREVVDFFRGRKLDEKLLHNLNIMLHSINSLADDAEQKQFRDPHVKAWLFAVKEAVFDAEDLLDEIDYEHTRCEVEAEAGSEPQTITYKVSNFFNATFSSFNKKLDSRLKEVLKKLEYLARQKGALGLKECTYSSVGSDRYSEFNAKQLGRLNLHGRLSIKELQNIMNSSDALVMELKNKTHLVTLKLKWNKNHILDNPRKEKKVLENLQPSKYLETLGINNYGGIEFPNWVFDNSLPNLVFLQLKNCKYILCLPPLGLLSSLKTLKIIGLDGIVSIGAEFYGGSDSSSFKSLERLEFYNMKEWEEWECKTASFPRLQRLSVNKCPKLKGLPEQLHLKKLIICSCEILTISGHSMDPSTLEVLKIHSCPLTNVPITHYDLLEEMEIDGGCDFLTTFPLDFFPKLRFLKLSRCRNLQRISHEHTHDHLKYLIVEKCPQFESFPSEGLSAPWLQGIEIRGAKNLKLLPKHMQTLLPSLTDLHIIDCPQVEMFPDGFPSNVKYVSLSSLKLIASLSEILDANTCLKSLSIEKVDVECFPDEVLLPRSLTSLSICDCPNLKKMDYKGLCHLSSLTLIDCPNLQCLPEEAMLKFISSLTVRGCPLLKQYCQNPEGKDWRKVAHIEELLIE